MKEKRPVVGKLCAELADVVVVTNEDPYTEDPEKIIDDVLSGVPPSMQIFRGADAVPPHTSPLQKSCVRISDRQQAIAFILREARKGDIVLLCGKGADITMMVSTGQVPWIERDIVQTALRSLLSTM